jgi:hypothetical protein
MIYIAISCAPFPYGLQLAFWHGSQNLDDIRHIHSPSAAAMAAFTHPSQTSGSPGLTLAIPVAVSKAQTPHFAQNFAFSVASHL